MIESLPLHHYITAVSVGIVEGQGLLDLCYEEDSAAEVDMNIIMSDARGFIELQGTGENGTFSQGQLEEMLALGKKGILDLIEIQKAALDGLELS